MTFKTTLLSLCLMMALVGCGDDGADDTGDATAASCTVLADGAYDFSGDSFGMMMSATLVMDADMCTFVFSNWNMGMSSPTGGSVAGDTVTFTGESKWASCSGDIAADGSVDALCTDDNTSFTMMPL